MNNTQYKKFQKRYRDILKNYNENTSNIEIEKSKQRELIEQLAQEMNLNIISSVTNKKAFFQNYLNE